MSEQKNPFSFPLIKLAKKLKGVNKIASNLQSSGVSIN